MMRPLTPNLAFPQPAEPSSPPETPTSPTFTFGRPPRSTRRNGVYNFSRPFPAARGDLHTAGQGQQFKYNPSMRPEDISPRSSSPSSDSSGSPPRSLSSEPEMPDTAPETSPIRYRIRSEGNFTIEELRDSDVHVESDDALSVVHPDHYEDAESDCARDRQPYPTASDLDAGILADSLEKLDCNNHNDDREAWVKQERKKRRNKRLSSGSHHKRTISQSIGSDTDDEDLQLVDANEAGSSARRLRRKTGDRGSLIFDDPPQMIVELDEPESGDEVARMQVAEPDVDVDVEELGLHSLPYYDTDTYSMEVDSDSE
jgi:hypothetical protein